MIAFFAFVLYYTSKAKRGKELYVRPIGGLSAMSEAVGRATEMGRPVLYVPGIADVDDIQTIAAVVILSEVSKLAASYEQPEEVVNWYFADPSRLGQIESLVLEEKVVDWVLENTDVTEVDSSFEEIMQRG